VTVIACGRSSWSGSLALPPHLVARLVRQQGAGDPEGARRLHRGKAAPSEALDVGLHFGASGEPEPETVTAAWGDEGEDPNEVGFVGTKPKD
jgi:hypothetical protein